MWTDNEVEVLLNINWNTGHLTPLILSVVGEQMYIYRGVFLKKKQKTVRLKIGTIFVLWLLMDGTNIDQEVMKCRMTTKM